MHIFRVIAQPHARIVAHQAGYGEGDHVLEQVAGGGGGSEEDGVDLRRRGSPRPERPDQLGGLVFVRSSSPAQAGEDRREQPIR